MHPKNQIKKMDFERRFLDKFRKEEKFPVPRPLCARRRESFSDQFLKSTFGASLKLRSKRTLKLSKISALKFRKRFIPSSDKRQPVSSIRKSETNLSSDLEHADTRHRSYHIPLSASGSVDCLPVSVNEDSFLPISASSSVITLSKPSSIKMPSPDRLGTFGRGDFCPYGSLLTEKTSKIRQISNVIHFRDQDAPCDLTLNRNESSCSRLSLPMDTFTPDSFASLYEKSNSYFRADYFYNISKDCQRIYQERRKSLSSLRTRTVSSINLFQEPNIQQNANSRKVASTYSHCVEDTCNQLIWDEKEKSSTVQGERKTSSAFHQELIKKCSNLKLHLKSSLPDDSISSLTLFPRKSQLTNDPLGLKIEISSTLPTHPICHATQNGGNVSNISCSKVPFSQPEASIKPQLLPKPFIPPKPEIWGERGLKKFPIPQKLERLRNDKIVHSYPLEINNNCISAKELSTMHNFRLSSDARELSENRSSFADNKNKSTELGTSRIEKSRLWKNEISQNNLRSKTCSENLQGSKVKNLVASFNSAFNSSESKFNSSTLSYKLLVA